ncbi:hypothetical protein HWV62_37183 [Athelia sp. TMB]|nr:hypothetical protein HWV62_37183 [Athelia sp. TMB]
MPPTTFRAPMSPLEDMTQLTRFLDELASEQSLLPSDESDWLAMLPPPPLHVTLHVVLEMIHPWPEDHAKRVKSTAKMPQRHAALRELAPQPSARLTIPAVS